MQVEKDFAIVRIFPARSIVVVTERKLRFSLLDLFGIIGWCLVKYKLCPVFLQRSYIQQVVPLGFAWA